MVQDPPHMRKAKRESQRQPVDFVGLVLVGTGLGAIQVVVDKGQRDDWFASSFILGFAITAACALVAFVFWEWKQKHPIVQLRLFKNSNFSVACLLMLTAFAVLLGSTVLIPLFAQTEMGYAAQNVGELLSPGGLAFLVLMPIMGFLASHIDARYMIGAGLLIVAFSVFHMTNLILNIDYRTLMMWRIYQVTG